MKTCERQTKRQREREEKMNNFKTQKFKLCKEIGERIRRN